MKKIIILLVMAMTILMCSVEKTDKKETKNEDKLPQKVIIGLEHQWDLKMKKEN